jgi:hypothetical protein
VFAGASLLMLIATRLALYGLKPAPRPILRIIVAHLIALALLTVVGGYDMPFLAGPVRWGYALCLLGFGTLPWLAIDLVRTLTRHPLRLASLATSPIEGEEERSPPSP